MHRFLRHFLHQLLELVRVRKLQLLLVIFVGSCLLAGEIYRERVVRELPVAVIDFDNSRTSRAVRLFLEATPELTVVEQTPTTVAEAEAMLVDGQLAGGVVLPADLSTSLKHGRKARALVGVDMSNVLVGRTSYRAIAKVLATVAGGVELSYLQKTGVPSRRAMAAVLPVVTDEHLSFNPTGSYSLYMAPSVTFFFLNLLVMVLVGQVFLPSSVVVTPIEALGRLAAIWTATMGAGLGLAYGLLPFFGLTSHSSLALFASALALFLLVDLLLAVALQAIVPSRVLAFQLGLLLGVLSLMLSGATFPVDAFPPAFQALSSALPFTAFSRGLRLFFNQTLSMAEMTEMYQQLSTQGAIFLGLMGFGWLGRRGLAQWAGRPA